MKKICTSGLIVFFLCIIYIPAFAGDFDGSKNLQCTCMKVIECEPVGDCDEVLVEDVGIPQFLRIDFAKKTINAPQWGENHIPSKIENQERIDGKLILQGAEDGWNDVKDGAGWSIAISENTGKMVLTESADQVGFIIFGACIPE